MRVATDKPSITVNYIYNLLYQLFNIVLPLVTIPYISRVLKAEAVGAYSFCNSIATFFSLIGILGLNIYGQLTISKCRDDRQQLSRAFFGIVISKSVTSTVAFLAFVGIALFSDEKKYIMLALSLTIIANLVDISWLYQGLEQFKKIVFRNFFVKSASVLLIFVFVKQEEDIILYALINSVLTLVANLSLWINTGDFIDRVELSQVEVFTHIKRSIPYFLPAIASSVYTVLDKSMLGWISKSDFENGIYEQAHKIELTMVTIVSSLSTVLLPRMSYLYSEFRINEYRKCLGRMISVAGLISIPMALGLFVVSKTLIPVFLGDGYEKSIVVLQILSVLVIFSGLNTLIGNQCLVAKGFQKQYNIGVIMGSVLNLFMNAILIPKVAAVGAAIASVQAEIVIFLIFLLYSRKDISFISLIKAWKKILLSAIGMAIVVGIVETKMEASIIALFMQIFIGIVIYLCGLILLKEEALNIFSRNKDESQ